MRRILIIMVWMATMVLCNCNGLYAQSNDHNKRKRERFVTNSKTVLDSKVKAIMQSYKSTGKITDVPDYFRITHSVNGPSIRIEIRTKENDSHALVAELEKMQATDIDMYKNVINATIPLDKLEQLETKAGIENVNVPLAKNRTGSVTGQHVQAHGVGNLQGSPSNLTGMGVTIGVMSDSYDCLGGAAADVSSGDLPTVTNLEEMSPCTGATDEGRALAQLVYDMAPGSSIIHHSAFNGMASFASGIGELVTAGCDIIVDDIIYFAETWYQDDIIAQAVDAADAAGRLYFSAAGNSKNGGYEHPSPGSVTEDGNQWLIFNGTDNSLNINVPAGSTVIATLQWDDPIQNIDTDLDLYLYRVGNVSSVESSTGLNVNSETILWENTGNAPEDMEILVDHYGGPLPGRFKIVIWNSDVTITDNYSGIGTSTILGHSNAAGAIAVASANYWDTPGYGTDPVQIWDGCPSNICSNGSSYGGQLILFSESGATLRLAPENRQKPDIIGAQGMNTTFFGTDIALDADNFPNFFGTSAAAPAAAGIAALLIEANVNQAIPISYSQLVNCIFNNTNNGFFDAEASAMCVDASILPVILSSFSVKSDECSISLNWKASSERNFSHYEVEKSMDGIHFNRVAVVPAEGDLRSSGYMYVDQLPSETTYYRLKMVDLDATYSYSDIKHANSKCDVTEKILHLPFNILPASSGLLVYEISGQAQINHMIITDVSGKILMSLYIDEDSFIGTVDVSQLSKGMYYISTTDALMGRVTKEFFVL